MTFFFAKLSFLPSSLLFLRGLALEGAKNRAAKPLCAFSSPFFDLTNFGSLATQLV